MDSLAQVEPSSAGRQAGAESQPGFPPTRRQRRRRPFPPSEGSGSVPTVKLLFRAEFEAEAPLLGWQLKTLPKVSPREPRLVRDPLGVGAAGPVQGRGPPGEERWELTITPKVTPTLLGQPRA